MITQLHCRIEGEAVHVEHEFNWDLEQVEQLVINPPDPISTDKNAQYLLFWGERADTTKSRIAGNYGIRHALVLDYDGSVVEEEVKFNDFYLKYNGKFKFWMHTSWNHIIKGFDKFRVIIPVQNPYYMHEPLKQVLLRVFKGCDPTTFGDRGFYIPVKRDNYQYAISEGKILDISCFDTLVANEIARVHAIQLEKAREREAYIAKYGDTTGSDQHRENWLNKVKEGLDSIAWSRDGSGRYSKLQKTIWAMQKHDVLRFNSYEIEEFLDEYISHLDSKNQRSLRKMIEKG